MAKKKTNEVLTETNETVAETPATDEKELVVSANFKSTVVLTNCTQNTICITDGLSHSITIAPREIKTVERDKLKELMSQEMVRRYFDKGLLTSTLDADEKSASDAEAPAELKNAVERHQDGSTVSAEVKKFEKQGTVSINLG